MKKIKQYSSLLLGLFLVALAFNLFFAPFNFVPGGVSGLAIVMRVFGISESWFIFVTNLLLLVISYQFLGTLKTKNTLLGSLLFPLFVTLTENVSSYIHLDVDYILVVIIGGVISGVGYGIIFRNNFTTGGTDILNQMVEKYLKIPMSKSILFIDGFIVFLGCIFFGLSNMIYSLIALILISYVSNKVQLGINKNRVLYITSSKTQEIRKFLEDSGYDVTILKRIGGYTSNAGKLLISSIGQRDYYRIKEGIYVLDKNAFLVVTNAYEQRNANVTLRRQKKI